MKKKNYIAEISFLVILLLIDIAFISQLTQTEGDAMQVVDAVQYARAIVTLFTVALLAVLGQSILRFRKLTATTAAQTQQSGEAPVQSEKLTILLISATGVLFFFYCFFMKRLGYYTSGAIVLELYQLVLHKAQEGYINWKAVLKVTAITVAVVAILYLIFTVLFELYLPRGLFR